MKILLLTPIQVEYEEVRKYLMSSSMESKQREGINYEKGSFKGIHHEYEVILRQTGSKNSDIALATERAIQEFNPEIVILTGIAGGVKDVAIGDVVVASKMYGYESGKETNDGFVARPEAIYCSTDLFDFCKVVDRSHQLQSNATVFFGPIAGGDKVISSTNSVVYERLKKHFNDTLALEMEAIGFGKVMLHYPLIKFINIRGVSDLLENKSETDGDGGQEKAMANAAEFVFQLLYQLDYAKLNIPQEVLEAKSLVKELHAQLKPLIEQEAGREKDVSQNPYLSALLEKVKLISTDAYKEVMADIEDEDTHAMLRGQLRKVLEADSQMAKSLKVLLDYSKEVQPATTTQIIDSKNVVVGSKFENNKSVHIGDTTTIEQQVNQPVYIDTYIINVNEVLTEAPKVVSEVEANATIEKIHDFIRNNKIKPALELLLSLTKSRDSDLHRQFLLLTNRWNRLMNEKMKNTILKEDFNIELNRILETLTHFADKI